MATIRRTTLRTGAALAVAPAAVAGTAAALPSLEVELHDWVVGQETAVSAMAAAIRRWRDGAVHPDRPLASFLFLGPKGVGKTHLAKAAASLVFGSPQALTRVDARRADPDALAASLRALPQQVVLVDEVDKTAGAALGWVRELLSTGRLRGADASQALVILTSVRPAAQVADVAALTERVTFRPLTPTEQAEVQRRMERWT
jgi:ATP-dependent Clp protease ATP-binding subunit ClpA